MRGIQWHATARLVECHGKIGGVPRQVWWSATASLVACHGKTIVRRCGLQREQAEKEKEGG
ncbi:MAG: hypothetical protein II746_07415 [Bacteroidaceae bacterium]|nr:hypothetical protein [Bacteroidaceae bacterium]